jgi:tetratricopeptide (TPR) repeat protein
MIKKFFSKKNEQTQQPTFDIANAFQSAMQYHQTGDFPQADALYRKILQYEPNNPDVLHYLGLLLHQTGQNEAAVKLISQAIQICPAASPLYCNLGLVLQALGKLEAAVENYQKALSLQPDFVQAYFNLGNVLCTQGKLDEAIENYRQIISLNPNFSLVYKSLGRVFEQKNDLEVAKSNYQKAISLNPDDAEAYCNLAMTFRGQNRLDEMIENFQKAIAVKPDYVDAYNNLGVALKEQGKLDLAIENFQRVIVLKPDFADAYNNLAGALQEQGKLKDAVANYQHALELNPNAAMTRMNLGLLLLSLGRFSEGWQYCEARFDPSLKNTYLVASTHFEFPRWQGESIIGKSLLIWSEQGFGDEVQFCRYVTVLKAQGVGQITWVCKEPLKDLIMTLKGIDNVLTQQESFAATRHNYWTFALSLPLHCKTTTLDAIPATIPYLFANSELVSKIALELSTIRDFKIGICWKGSSMHKNDKNRSPGIAAFEGLFKMQGVKFFTLQPDTRQELLEAAGKNGVDRKNEIDTSSFAEAAALIMNLDLVISCDTSICHLAGALGKPVWIVLPFLADWRWLFDREDSPWYPTMRLFRQVQRGDWNEIFQRVEKRLQAVITGDSPIIWPV